MNRFDILLGHYVYYLDYHEGQDSREYARMCRIGSKCRFSDRALSLEDEEGARDVYNALVERRGGKCYR